MSDEHPDTSSASSASSGSLELAPGLRVHASEVSFTASRSGGPGGQNVNKVSTRMELRLPVRVLEGPGRLPAAVMARLRLLAGGRITKEDEMILTSGRFRSQARNRQACLDVLRELIVRARVSPKARRPTKPGRSAVQRRLREKKSRSEIKRGRRGPAREE